MNPSLFANQYNDLTLYQRTFVQERCRYNNSKTFARHAVTLKFETRNVLAKHKKVVREHKIALLILGMKILKEERSVLRDSAIRKQLDSVHVAAVVGS
jgi:hypothetical protein